MKITQFTDYSLRLLFYLARNRDRVVTVREVAEYYSVSAEHLKKIVRRLADLGHISTVRGKHGGLRIAREPEQINLGELVRNFENIELMPCCDPETCCPVAECRLKKLIDTGLTAFLSVLDARTLADIL
jgi:Rrf2 family nitric oxide-sensitive transcriptional repressor